MNRSSLLTLLTLAAFGAGGCAADHSGAYTGQAVESGTIKIAVPQTTNVAKNEAPPHLIPDATVTVTKEGADYLIKFGSCELKGQPAGPTTMLVKGPCDVKVTSWEGKLPLSATLSFGEGNQVTMDVMGTAKTDTTVIEYSWAFKGKRR